MSGKRFLFPGGPEEEAKDPSFLFCKRAGALGPPRHLPGQVKGRCSSRSKGSTVQSTSPYCRETSSVPPGGRPNGDPCPSQWRREVTPQAARWQPIVRRVWEIDGAL